MFSILHLSDLHRSTREPVSNAELVSALVRDCARYANESPPVRPPDAVIVSGDLVNGVSLGTPDSDRILAEQYDVAFDFITELVGRFLGGDRSRVVVVPGNHDVDWNKAASAMRPVPPQDTPQDLPAALFREGSGYRWSWDTRQLLFVADHHLYEARFDAFREFFARFYQGVPGLLRVEAKSDTNLFALDDGRIGVAAFNSCAENDCFARHGVIPRPAVAQADLDLSDLAPPFDLRLAVWHHGVEGPPQHVDYMDVDVVRGMIGRGFRMGFYGHHHRSTVAAEQVYLPDRETMGIIGAGSLCAGADQLPPGFQRQYNVVEIADDYLSARVHVREMVATNLFGRAQRADLGGRSYVDLGWEPVRNAAGRAVDARQLRIQRRIEEAEAALMSGDAATSVRLLATELGQLEGHGRRVLLESAVAAERWDLVLKLTAEPRSVGDLVYGFQARVRCGDPAAAIRLLDELAAQVGMPAAIERDLRSRIASEVHGT